MDPAWHCQTFARRYCGLLEPLKVVIVVQVHNDPSVLTSAGSVMTAMWRPGLAGAIIAAAAHGPASAGRRAIPSSAAAVVAAGGDVEAEAADQPVEARRNAGDAPFRRPRGTGRSRPGPATWPTARPGRPKSLQAHDLQPRFAGRPHRAGSRQR